MIDILYENADYTVCVKPVGIQSQNDNAEDMVKLLSRQTGSDIFPVHRLDTAVGGTMVFAKNPSAAAELSKQITDKTFAKRYLAVLSGIPETRSGTLEDLLFKDSAKNKTYVVRRERKGVKKASLEYAVLSEKDGKALISVRLHTGRTHQIRVQFSSRKLPLVGDGKYGSRDSNCNIALWSESVSFNYNGKRVKYNSLPDCNIYPWNLFNFNECLSSL